MEVAYISKEDAIRVHRKTVMKSGGGSYAILDDGRIDSILHHIKNDDYYPTFLDKLHHLCFALCKFHCFADGNKRIAISLSAYFLLINGYLSEATTFLAEMENIAYHVASGAISEELLKDILKAIIEHTYKDDDVLAFAILQSIQAHENVNFQA